MTTTPAFRVAASGADSSPSLAGVVAGDVVVAVVFARAGAAFTFTTPAGWTLVDTANASSTQLYGWILTKAATASGTESFTPSFSTAPTSMTWHLAAYSGAELTHLVDAHALATSLVSSTLHTVPAVTTTTANTLEVAAYAGAGRAGTNTWTPPTGWTERGDVASTIGSSVNSGLAEVAHPTVSTRPATTATATQGTGEHVAFAVALAPIGAYGAANSVGILTA